MEAVRCRLLRGGLPIGRHDEFLRRPEHLESAVRAAEQQIEIELRVTEELLERRALDIPGGEDQSAIELHACLPQTKILLGEYIAVHLLALDGRAHEAAIRAERPTV